MVKVGFLFPGQGSQFVGMGKSAYEVSPAAKEIFEKANQIMGFDIAKLCFEGPEEKLTLTKNSQPAIFITSMAVLNFIREKFPDLKPMVGLGLSLGEYTALVGLGSLSFEEGLKLVKIRGEAMEEATQETEGTMASVLGMEVEACQAVCDSVEGAWIANLNSPGQIVISGTIPGVTQAGEACKEKGARKVIPLKVSGAFHTPLMVGVQERLKEAVQNSNLKEPNGMFLPNFTASPESNVEQIRDFLLKQLTGTVKWSDSLQFVIKEGVTKFLEIGPGSVLKGLMKKIDKTAEVISVETK